MSVTDSNDELNADGEQSPAPSAATPDESAPGRGTEPTASPEPTSGTALADDPVLSSDPELPNDREPSATSADEVTGASAQFDTEQTPELAHATERNWMGYVAFATGALALSVVAIVLGHLGLTAAKQARSNNRDFALAGLILGYIGLVATAVGLWFALGDRTSPAHVDVQAQQDVSAVGAAAATAASQTGEVPQASLTETGYLIAGKAIDSHLAGERALTLTGDGPANWCLDIAYEGGEHAAFSYTATTGMAQGRCGP